MAKNILTTLLAVAFSAATSFGSLVDTAGQPVTDQTALGDIDMAQSLFGDLRDEIAPGYETVSNAAVNAVSDSMAAATNTVPAIDLMSTYGIASAVSNELEQMVFTGCLLTNNFTMAYDSSAASPSTWAWTLYSGKSSSAIATGTVEGFSPMSDGSVVVSFAETAAAGIYESDSVEFYVGQSQMMSSGLAREKDLTTIVYNDETGWMAMYFKGQKAKHYPNSNQVVKIAQSIAPTKVSQLTNDSEFVTKSVTNDLAREIRLDTNFVRRTDTSLGFGSGNTLGTWSQVLGNNNTLGNRSVVFGFSNSLLSPSAGVAQQYAFGMGNNSQARDNFIAGIGSGATVDGANSISLGTMAVSTNLGAFVWNWFNTDYYDIEADQIFSLYPKYYSHGEGTFNVNPVGGLRGFWVGETNLEQHVQAIASFVTTNKVVIDYTPWQYSGNTSSVYTIILSESQTPGSYDFILRDTVDVTDLGTVTTNTLNPTMLVYDAAGITASRDEVLGNQNGFAYRSDVRSLRNEIQSMNTSYIRFDQTTNINQSVQYVVATAGMTTVDIKIPENGETKDWIVYVNTNDETPLQLVLPEANYWVSDESVTNDITQATALYFSQVTDNPLTFAVGRKEFVPVTITVQSAVLMSMPSKRKKSSAVRIPSMTTIKK